MTVLRFLTATLGVDDPLAMTLLARGEPDWELWVDGDCAIDHPQVRRLDAPRWAETVTAPGPEALWALAGPDVALRHDAVERLREALTEHPAACAVHADERRDGQWTPMPGWSPAALESTTAFGEPLVVKATTLAALTAAPPVHRADRYRLALRLAETGADVVHLPATLADRRAELPHATMSAVITEHFAVGGRNATLAATAWSEVVRIRSVRAGDVGADTTTTTVIVPSAGAVDPATDRPHLDHCLTSLAAADDGSLDVIVVVGDEFGGDPESIAATDHGGLRVRVERRPPGPFDFSAAVNTGLLRATGEHVLLCNDDVRAADGAWLPHLRRHLADPSVAAVGPMLTYPDGTIQHLGMVLDDARPLHSFVGYRPEQLGPRSVVPRDVVAVTGACLLARRRDLLAVGGLSSRFPVSFNDVDLCLRLGREKGRIVVEPLAHLEHHESASRPARIADWEWDRFVQRWGEVADPWYHPGYVRPDDPSRLRRNADHLPPDATPPDHPARDGRLRPGVHHARVTPDDDAARQ